MLTREEFDKLPKEQQEMLLKQMEAVEKGAGEPEKHLKQLNMEEFRNVIEETVKNLIKPMTEVDRKHFAFPGTGKPDGDLSPEGKFAKTIKFFNALVNKDVHVCKAISEEVRTKANLSEGATTAGGFLVPEEFKAEILRLAPNYGVIRQNCRIIPMRYDTLNIPAAGTTDQSAIWTNEAAQIKQTDPNFRQVTLTINKLGAIPKVSNELLRDANVDIINYLSMLIAEAFAKAEDIQGFKGVGSPFVGVMNATGAPTYPHASGTGFECLSYQDLVRIPSYLYENAASQGKFYFHRSLIGHIRSRITTTGAPIFNPVAREIFGYPVVSTEVLPGIGHTAYQTDATTYAVFGDLRRGLLMGERGTIEMALSTEATVASDNLFEKDMAALRMIERVCFGVALPSAFVKILS